MNPTQTITKMANGNNVSDNDIRELAQAVARQSNRGEWYDGPDSTNVSDWIAEADLTGNETVESLAAEWDS